MTVTPEQLRAWRARAANTIELQDALGRVDGVAMAVDASQAVLALVAEVERLAAAHDEEWANATRNLAIATKATAERDEARRHRAETNAEIKRLHAMIKAKGFSVEDSVALNELRQANATLRDERDAARAVLDQMIAEVRAEAERITDGAFYGPDRWTDDIVAERLRAIASRRGIAGG